MHVPRSLNHPSAVWFITVAGAASALIYIVWFALAYPLLSLYEQPLLDLGKLTDHEPTGALAFFAPLMGLFMLYGCGYRAIATALAHAPRARWIITGAPLVFISALLVTYPIGAIDIFDYTFHARLFALYDVSPIAHVAAEFPNDPWLKYVAWPTTPSPYGPVWQGLAIFEYQLAGANLLGNLIGLKLLAGISLLADATLAALIMHRIRPAETWAAFYLVAWNRCCCSRRLATGTTTG